MLEVEAGNAPENWRVYDDARPAEGEEELDQFFNGEDRDKPWKSSKKKWFGFDSVLNPHSKAIRVSPLRRLS